jgi:hypothetical protein
MKIRIHFIPLIVLVIAIGLAGARISQGDPADKTSLGQMATKASCSAAAAAPATNLGSSAISAMMLRSTNERSTSERSSPSANVFPPPCSVCSDFSCQTHSLGASCGGTATCQQLSDRLCSTDGQITCRCVTSIP